jgi:hypothetical protein
MRRAVRMTRHAISPRFAISSLPIIVRSRLSRGRGADRRRWVEC